MKKPYEIRNNILSSGKHVPMKLLADGLHSNDRGYDGMYDLMLKELRLS